jgi:hypothetical protein
LLVLASALLLPGKAAAVSPLFARGYTLLPDPQQVKLTGPDVYVDKSWSLKPGAGVRPDNIAVESLREGFKTRLNPPLELGAGQDAASGVILLEIVPGSVQVGQAADKDKAALAQQAYELEITPGRIGVRANADAGLFYGVQSLLQLVRSQGGAARLPGGQIVDWPDLQLRTIYWDDAHHLERTEELKRAIRQAAFYKINGIFIKLEGHFQYRSAPAIVEPYALSPTEFQDLTNYGLRHYVQLIPYLDGPAHIAFILKHPEYAQLRAFPNINYELCVTNSDSYKLLFGMYEDLLAANKGVKYFFLSTDEPYYVGLADNPGCREAARAKELGSNGKLYADFITRTADFLHDRGRNVVFWVGDPLKPDDVAALPKHLINGEGWDPALDPPLKEHGNRQMVYTVTQGLEDLFPNYSILPMSRRLHPPDKIRSEHVPDDFAQTEFEPLRKRTDLMGSMNAAWADNGLHPETFWLGYVAASSEAWRPGSLDPAEATSAFFEEFYGPGATNMGRVYQLMSLQAQFWTDSWDTIPASRRNFGNCSEPRCPQEAQPVDDQTLPLPSVPSSKDLSYNSTWSRENTRRLQLAEEALIENDELINLLYANLHRVAFNRYNLEVFISIAQVYRQNLLMLRSLVSIDAALDAAGKASSQGRAAEAVSAVDQALATAEGIRRERNKTLREVTDTWLRSWQPRVREANGRRFLHEFDNVKDHVPDWTVDMKYLIYRQLLLPFGEWVSKVQSARNEYAKKNNLGADNTTFNWKDTEAGM